MLTIHKQPTNRCSYVRLLTFILIAFLILISHIVWHNQQANVTQLDIQSGALKTNSDFAWVETFQKGISWKCGILPQKFSNSCTDIAYNISESALLGIAKMCSIGFIAIWSALELEPAPASLDSFGRVPRSHERAALARFPILIPSSTVQTSYIHRQL